METQTMGKTLVRARITNIRDLLNAKAGALAPDQVRSIEVEDAVVDTGAKYISLPARMIEQLGLELFATRSAITAAGRVPCKIYYAARLEIQGRECTVEVTEVPDTCPVLIGYLALKAMDFVVDPVKQQVIGNPAHGGQEIIELY
jgi:clan AA aspartic protease